MPTFPTSQVGYALLAMNAAKATLEGDPNLEPGGNLGVVSIAKARTVPDGTQLIMDWHPAGKCPELSVWCIPGEQVPVLTMTDAHEHLLEVYLTVERARTRNGGLENYLVIINSAVNLLKQTIRAFPTQWLGVGQFTQLNGNPQVDDDWQEVTKMRKRMRIRGTVPFRVIRTEVV